MEPPARRRCRTQSSRISTTTMLCCWKPRRADGGQRCHHVTSCLLALTCILTDHMAAALPSRSAWALLTTSTAAEALHLRWDNGWFITYRGHSAVGCDLDSPRCPYASIFFDFRYLFHQLTSFSGRSHITSKLQYYQRICGIRATPNLGENVSRFFVVILWNSSSEIISFSSSLCHLLSKQMFRIPAAFPFSVSMFFSEQRLSVPVSISLPVTLPPFPKTRSDNSFQQPMYWKRRHFRFIKKCLRHFNSPAPQSWGVRGFLFVTLLHNYLMNILQNILEIIMKKCFISNTLVTLSLRM